MHCGAFGPLFPCRLGVGGGAGEHPGTFLSLLLPHSHNWAQTSHGGTGLTYLKGGI